MVCNIYLQGNCSLELEKEQAQVCCICFFTDVDSIRVNQGAEAGDSNLKMVDEKMLSKHIELEKGHEKEETTRQEIPFWCHGKLILGGSAAVVACLFFLALLAIIFK